MSSQDLSLFDVYVLLSNSSGTSSQLSVDVLPFKHIVKKNEVGHTPLRNAKNEFKDEYGKLSELPPDTENLSELPPDTENLIELPPDTETLKTWGEASDAYSDLTKALDGSAVGVFAYPNDNALLAAKSRIQASWRDQADPDNV